MTKADFLAIITEDTGLNAEDAERVSRGVFATLRSQLSREENAEVCEAMSGELDAICEGGWLQKFTMALQSLREMDKGEFIEQVRESTDAKTGVEAERLARAVFRALKSSLPFNETIHIAHDLPDDLKDLWNAA